MSYAVVNMFCIEQLSKALQYLMHVCRAKCAVAALQTGHKQTKGIRCVEVQHHT